MVNMSKKTLSIGKQPSISSFLTKKPSNESAEKITRSQSPTVSVNNYQFTSPSIFEKKKSKLNSPGNFLSSDDDSTPQHLKSKIQYNSYEIDMETQKLREKYGLSPVRNPSKKSVPLETSPDYIKASRRLEATLNKHESKASTSTNAHVNNNEPAESCTGKFKFKLPKSSTLSNGSSPSSTAPETNLNTLDESPEIMSPEIRMIRQPLTIEEDKYSFVPETEDFTEEISSHWQNPKTHKRSSSPEAKTQINPKIRKPTSLQHSSSSQKIRENGKRANFSVHMDSSISENVATILNSDAYRTNDINENVVQRDVNYLKEQELTLLNQYFQLMNQIPSNFFSDIPGFDKIVFMKLKSTIENVQEKIIVKRRSLNNIQNVKKRVVSDKRVSRVPSLMEVPSNSIENDLNFANEVNHREKPKKTTENRMFDEPLDVVELLDSEVMLDNTQEQSKSFIFKKPVASSLNDSFSQADDFENFSTDEIMESVNQEELIDRGRFNRLSIVDLTDLPSTSSANVGFKPRINLAGPSSTITSTQTSTIDLDDVELDDDGFPVIDTSLLEDVVPTQPENLGFQTAKQVQVTNQKRQKVMNSLVAGSSQTSSSSSSAAVKSTGIGRFHAGVHNDGITGQYDGFNFPHSHEMKLMFQEKFGLKTFRPNQLQAINATLLGHDCFILMPTGGGKSLCYQLPALLARGVTIVVSPLKSLIIDQVNKLLSLDIPAAHLSGEVSLTEWRKIYSDLESSRPTLRLLYVTPEKISASAKFQSLLDTLYQKGLLARFVIDEAHCVSAWGHDFRPDYKKLNVLKTRYHKVPMLALTATANMRVREDVLKQLRLKNTKWFLCSFNRPNLRYIVLPKKGSSTMNDIISLIQDKFKRASGIIYCLSRKDCETTADKLVQSGIKACCYHAGLTDNKRESVQKDWLTDKFRVVCATIAFGMGIDKPNVRYVFHYSMPKSIEGYYQESGRAGRDGELATCILYYNYSDMLRYRKMLDQDNTVSYEAKQINIQNLHKIVNYCENLTDCRRSQQLEYFGEHFSREQCLENRPTACDNCLKAGQYKEIDATDNAMAVVRGVKDICSGNNRFTILHMVEVFKGTSIQKIMDNRHNLSPHYGILKKWEKIDIQRLMHKLVVEEYLQDHLIFTNDIPQAYIQLGPKVSDLMMKKVKVIFSLSDKKVKNTKQVEVSNTEDLFASNPLIRGVIDRCYKDLVDICTNIANEKGCAISSIMNMQALKIMSEKLPKTEEEMLVLPYVTRANFEKYGRALLEVTQNYAAEKELHVMDLKDVESSESEGSEPENTDWDALGRQASSQSIANRGTKRKGKWGGRRSGVKKFRRMKKRSPKKRATGSTPSGSKKATAKASGSKFQLLPMPGFSSR